MIDRPMTFQNFIIATRGRRVKDDQLILSAVHVAVVVACPPEDRRHTRALATPCLRSVVVVVSSSSSSSSSPIS